MAIFFMNPEKIVDPAKISTSPSPSEIKTTAQTVDLSIILDDEHGYYVIGPPEETKDCQIYVISVSINGMKNLINVSL